jgi:N-acetylglucosaminyl-diphospho-decaprenol L-rhamnosyltransferase
MSSVHVLVLNYNGEDLLRECLPSVVEAVAQSSVPARLSVVDNASADGSWAWLKKEFPQVGWIPRKTNSILYAYNEVAAMVDEDFVLLLNNDIKVEPNFIGLLFDAMRALPHAFAASPRHVDFRGRYNGGMNRCGRRLSLAWAGPDYPGCEADSKRPGQTLFTGNGLFRRDKFLALGGFDRLYAPMGWEDADLCTRAWRKGWPTLYVPASLIHHKSSASIARAFSLHRRRALGFRNATLWLAANAPAAELLKAALLLPFTVLACLLTGRLAQLDGLLRSLPRLIPALARRGAGDDAWWEQFSAKARHSEGREEHP